MTRGGNGGTCLKAACLGRRGTKGDRSWGRGGQGQFVVAVFKMEQTWPYCKMLRERSHYRRAKGQRGYDMENRMGAPVCADTPTLAHARTHLLISDC